MTFSYKISTKERKNISRVLHQSELLFTIDICRSYRIIITASKCFMVKNVPVLNYADQRIIFCNTVKVIMYITNDSTTLLSVEQIKAQIAFCQDLKN